MTALTSTCQDCETGACPCGATCEGCDHTGICSSCGGRGVVPGPPPVRNRLSRPGDGAGRPNPRATGHRWSTRPAMPKCPGCDREHTYETPFYGLSPKEVHERVNADRSTRSRPRCAVCGFPFGSPRSQYFVAAAARGQAEVWSDSLAGPRRTVVSKWPNA